MKKIFTLISMALVAMSVVLMHKKYGRQNL